MTVSTTVSLRAVFDVIPLGLAVFDGQQALRLANARFAGGLGLPADRVTEGLRFDGLLALLRKSDGGAALSARLRDAAWTAKAHRWNGMALDPLPDGGFALSVTPKDGIPEGPKDEAHRRARLLDLVLLNVPHGICVYGPDRRVAMFNDTYVQVMAGAPLQVGDTLTEVIRRRAESGEYGEGEPDKVYATQMAFDIGRPQMRCRVRPNGTAIDIRTAPLPDGGHISVVTDISPLVQAEMALRRRAEEMATMLGHIRHGIMLWGPDRRLVASNPVAADLLDLPGDLLTPGRSEAEVLSHLGHQLTSDGDHSTKQGQEIVTGSGRVLQALSNPAPGGGWISTFTDITRMREAESALRTAKERAEAANQAKSRFLATMSHELLTPLNAIIGFSEALARDGGDVPANLVSDYSGQINTAGKQLLSLINIVLDVARIESGRFEPDAEIVDIGKAMRTAQRQVDGAARAGDVSVELRIPDELPWLRGDERRITQVLSQVLSNAVKFTQSGGSVLVEAGLTEAEDVFVSVTDTGIGIPEDELERVFQPFSQIDGSLSRRYQGAGLGLFTARAVVTAHGGTLLLTSQRGAGTTARIVLPRTRLIERADR